jgi:Collagen triple helix repeat (20 copies)
MAYRGEACPTKDWPWKKSWWFTPGWCEDRRRQIENERNAAAQRQREAEERERQRLAAIAAAAQRERERIAREAAERAAAAQRERERIAREAAERAAAAERERQRLAAEAAERERQRLAAEARARAKKAAEDEMNAAKAAIKPVLDAWENKKKEYEAASKAVPPLKLVYDNAQMALDNARAKKAAYDEAIAQQTAANALLTSATDLLSKGDAKLKENLEKTFAENVAFMKSAASFANTTFEIEKQYNEMSTDWTAFSAARTALAAVDSKKTSELSDATDKLVETYNKFIASKGVYNAAVIKALKANNADSEYVKNSKTEIDTYGLIYDLSKDYNAMTAAWANVKKSVDASDASAAIINYIAYVPTKNAFTNSLLIAQNKRAEADFQTKMAAGKEAAAKWLKSGSKGCRNVQTAASTDQNMLDQDIVCNDTEYISGYTKVSGYDAAPVDSNVTRDNIAQYLAVKYSCCTAPEGPKGPQGKKGLPGLDAAPGAIGPQGPDGVPGPVGKKGEQGDMGEEGGKGPRGDTGDDGKEGEPGHAGKPGKSVVVPFIRQVPGPMGPRGEAGPQGKRGAKGPDGIIKPAPSYGFSELDRTVALLNVKDKINNYLRG